MRKKVLLLFNPRSGKGLIKMKLFDIIDTFTKAGFEVIAHPTQSAQDASKTVLEYAERVDLLVCSGGDGTLDEAVDGLMKIRPALPVGYIPTGSTNDFASSLNISKLPVKAAKDIVTGKVHPCDVGKFNHKSFVYVAAFGLFTDVSYETDQNMKNILGHFAYLLEAGKRMFNVPSYHFSVESEEKSLEADFVYGMVTNARSVGGIKHITGDNIDMSDGLFEVTLVYPPKNPIELQEILMTLLTPNATSKFVVTFKTPRIHFHSDERVSWTLDGEFGGENTDVLIEDQHRQLNIVLNY